MFNTYTGSLCKISQSTNDLLKNNDFEQLPINIKEDLCKEGFLVPCSIDETNKLIYEEQRAIYTNNGSLVFVIAPTLCCNYKCTYCFEKDRLCASDANINVNPSEIINFIIKQAKLLKARSITLSWFGGEPTLKLSQIQFISYKIKSFCDQHNINLRCKMITNGSKLDDDIIKKLISDSLLTHVQISLDGSCDEYCIRKNVNKEMFYKVINNILYFSNYIKIDVRLNCDGTNYDSIKAVVSDIVKETKIKKDLSNIHFYLAKIIDYSNLQKTDSDESNFFTLQENFNQFLSTLGYKNNNTLKHNFSARPIFCGLRRNSSFVIGPNGELYKCEHDIGNNQHVVGDIHNGYYYNNYLMDYISSKIQEKCKTCKLLPICMGGCNSISKSTAKGYDCYISENFLITNLKNYIHLKMKV